MNRYNDGYGMQEISRLFGVDPSTVRNWCAQGFLTAHRNALGRRRVAASNIVAMVKIKETPEEMLDAKIWREVRLTAANEAKPVVCSPVALIVDVQGAITGMTVGSWHVLGYNPSDLDGGDKHLDLKLSLKDPDIGVPMAFRDIDRATYEPLRVQWESLNDESKSGLAWITPLRTGEDSIGGWTVTFDSKEEDNEVS